MKERRYFSAADLRVETRADGQRYLTGLMAPYNNLSEDMGGWYERIRPGAFSRMLRSKQDVCHLVNHIESQILGRTSAGTTELWEDEKGLHGRTALGTRSYEKDLVESVERRDIFRNSFAFLNAVKPEWKEERSATGVAIRVRELVDLDVFDVSTVTNAAYSDTHIQLRSRALFPDGDPVDVAERRGLPETHLELRRFSPVRPELRAVSNAAGILEIVIYGYIGENWWSDDPITVKRIKRAIDAVGAYTSVLVRINSGGGSAFEGIAIRNLLRALGRPVKVCVDGLAASAGSIVAMAGDDIVMGLGSMMMIHCPWTMCVGYASDMRTEADLLDKLSIAGAEIYADRTGKPVVDMVKLMEAETWMTSQEAVAQGFATEIGAVRDVPAAEPPVTPPVAENVSDVEDPMDSADLSLMTLYRNAPAELRERAANRGTKMADGERLPRAAFLIQGEENNPATWKLPVEFSDEAKRQKHLRTAVHRLAEMPLAVEVRSALEPRVRELCAKHGVEVDNYAESAAVRLRALRASL